MSAPGRDSETSKVPFWTQFHSFDGVFWLANVIELVERFGYFGARAIAPVFMMGAFKDGGLELSALQKGEIFAIWAVVQAFVPVLSGGFTDRFGYKLSILVATVLRIVGFVAMGFTVMAAERLCGQSLAAAGDEGKPYSYWIFFSAAMFLALGTAVFKPGVQGLIAARMPKEASSLGWGIFYQTVNIGGFCGPIIAGYLCVLSWPKAFFMCAASTLLTFVILFFFQEPAHPARSGPKRDSIGLIVHRTLHGLLEPRLFFFTISFAGFWFMFNQLFDTLPNFIDDWIDSSHVRDALIGVIGNQAVPPPVGDGNLPQAWIIALNALMICCLAFGVGYLTGRLRSLSAIIIGVAISIVGIHALGLSMNCWYTLLAIAVFSIGEMMASPTKIRYLASIAPPGKEGQYMGYVNFTFGIGWSIGNVASGFFYNRWSDKVLLAKQYLIEQKGLDPSRFKNLAKDGVFDLFQKELGVDPAGMRDLLWREYQPYHLWTMFAVVGLASLLAVVAYDRVIRRADANPDHSLNTRGQTWVLTALIPLCIVLLAATLAAGLCSQPYAALGCNAAFFWAMLVVCLSKKRDVRFLLRVGSGAACGLLGLIACYCGVMGQEWEFLDQVAYLSRVEPKQLNSLLIFLALFCATLFATALVARTDDSLENTP